MTKQKTTEVKVQPVNLKEANAQHTFGVMIRDREHFYRVVNWLNTNVGKGVDKWTMQGRILKTLNTGKSVNTSVYVFLQEFDPSSALYLSLI